MTIIDSTTRLEVYHLKF